MRECPARLHGFVVRLYRREWLAAEQRLVVVAGFLGTAKQWRRFARDWDALLKHHRIPYLHMREFAHSKPPSTEWEGDGARRAALLDAAAETIGEHVPNPMTLYISPAIYRSVDAEYQLAEIFSGAYPIVAGGCASHLRTRKESLYGNQPISYFVEAGDDGQTRFCELMRKSSLGIVPIPLSKKDETRKWRASFRQRTSWRMRLRSSGDVVAQGENIRLVRRLKES